MDDFKLILEVSEDGEMLTLDDGSEWAINIGDNTLVACWLPTQHIVVKQDNADDAGGYILQNLDTSSKEEVKATKVR